MNLKTVLCKDKIAENTKYNDKNLKGERKYT